MKKIIIIIMNSLNNRYIKYQDSIRLDHTEQNTFKNDIPLVGGAVLVRALTGDIVLCFWAKQFTLSVPLSTQVYK